jgi:hypothetical protein
MAIENRALTASKAVKAGRQYWPTFKLISQ